MCIFFLKKNSFDIKLGKERSIVAAALLLSEGPVVSCNDKHI